MLADLKKKQSWANLGCDQNFLETVFLETIIYVHQI